MNSEYAVGTLCVIVDAHPMHSKMIGRECTIVKGLHRPFGEADELVYEIDIEGEAGHWYAGHHHIKPKEPPKDAKFTEFLNKLLFPLPVEELEGA